MSLLWAPSLVALVPEYFVQIYFVEMREAGISNEEF